MIRKQALEGNFREGQHTSYAVSNHPDYSSIAEMKGVSQNTISKKLRRIQKTLTEMCRKAE